MLESFGNGSHCDMKAAARLVFIRHGKTQWNAERRYLGSTDLPLLPDALCDLDPLREQLQELDFQGVYSSDLKRCRETLKYVCPDSSSSIAIYDPRLREMDFGQWEGHTYEMLKDNPLYGTWIDHPKNVTPPGGESWMQFKERVSEFADDLLELVRTEAYKMNNQGKQSDFTHHRTTPRFLIVTHGGVIRMLYLLLTKDTDFWKIHVEHGSVLMIDVTWQFDQVRIKIAK